MTGKNKIIVEDYSTPEGIEKSHKKTLITAYADSIVMDVGKVGSYAGLTLREIAVALFAAAESMAYVSDKMYGTDSDEIRSEASAIQDEKQRKLEESNFQEFVDNLKSLREGT